MKSAGRRAIDLSGFEAKFMVTADPWQTFTARDEAIKRSRIVRALGNRRVARLLELASGNGSNSQRLARRALKLDACDGSASAVRHTQNALRDAPHARAWHIALPDRLPGNRYEAVVIAELLYYLPPRAMQRLARDVAGVDEMVNYTVSGSALDKVLKRFGVSVGDGLGKSLGLDAGAPNIR